MPTEDIGNIEDPEDFEDFEDSEDSEDSEEFEEFGEFGEFEDVDLAREQVLAMLGEFRRSLLLVPIRDGGVLAGDQDGLRWIYAFTDTDTLTAFARARGEGGEWEFRRVYGARLLDETVAEVGVPCGVAVDVGSEGAWLLPPAEGIVPDEVAVVEESDESEGASA